MAGRVILRVGRGLAAGLLVVIMVGLVIAFIQAKRTPSGRPEYVALGSSFAAGAGLGPLQAESPVLCARSVNGYPQVLARSLGLSIVNMSCGGAVTRHVLDGGQFFQGPQIGAITRETRLVTLTIGGNDIGYIGDLSLLAMRRDQGFLAALAKATWGGPEPISERNFTRLETELTSVLRAVRARAPDAVIVVATYPTILPQSGTCTALGLSTDEVDLMRKVGDRLAEASRTAAVETGAIFVDMHQLGESHDACSTSHWTGGLKNNGPAPFHPTQAGAQATASAIEDALSSEDVLARIRAS